MFPCAASRSRRSALALLVALTACTDTCSPGLQPEDAVPYQACSVDDDCVVDQLSCTDCTHTVAVARAQQQAFDGLRGCWPDPGGNQSSCLTPVPGLAGCTEARCSRGRCVVASGCGLGGTSGFGATTGGFTTGSVGASASTRGSFTATGSGNSPICSPCNGDSACESGFCNFSATAGVGFCDSVSFCTPTDCGAFACDTSIGDCVCGTAGTTTGTTGGSSSTSHGSLSGSSSASTGSGSSGGASSTGGTGTTGSSSLGSSGASDLGSVGGSGSSGGSGSGGGSGSSGSTGSPGDAGSDLDAGMVEDGGEPADGGFSLDAGPDLDAGTSADAGGSLDAGDGG